MTTSTWAQSSLLLELEHVVERELQRHLKSAKEWLPHEYIPWSQGRDYDGVSDFLSDLDASATRFEEKRDALNARLARRG